MTTIHQRLQSRISRRRNTIRAVERDVAVLASQRRAMRELGFERDDSTFAEVSGIMYEGKHMIRHMAADQKLDKELFYVLTGVSRNWAHHDFQASW